MLNITNYSTEVHNYIIEVQVKTTAGDENYNYVSKNCNINLIGYSITTTLSHTDNI